MISVRDVKHLLKCPVCFNEPQRGTTIVGMCANGHITCESCAHNILKRRNSQCPECRDADFRVVRGHKLAVSVINLVDQHELHACEYPNCQEQHAGNDVDRHKKVCSQKPIQCPIRRCLVKKPWGQFLLLDQHSCFTMCHMNEATKQWTFTVDIRMLYSMDSHEIKILPQLKFQLLIGNPDSNNRAYIGITGLTNDTVAIYSGWMDKKNDVSESIKNLNLHLCAYITTRDGIIRQECISKLKFLNEPITSHDKLLLLAKHTLYSWTEWSNQYQCHECPELKRKKPHIHILASFDQNV